MPSSLADLRKELKALRAEHCPPVSRQKKEDVIAEIERYKSRPAVSLAPAPQAPAEVTIPVMKGPPSVEVAIAKATKKLAKAEKKSATKTA